MNRMEWKALFHGLRALARANPRAESHGEWFRHNGAPWKLVRSRDPLTRSYVTRVEPAIIRDRAPSYRAALELAWARYFKREAATAYPRETMRPRKLEAARHCLSEAREILAARSAFHALPA